jgi:isoleucyl-tRNA synthetase
VDDLLSNWYVRRNRDRFWSKNADLDDAGRRDKLSAYQTLYTVLTTVVKQVAPVVPFLSEVMWRNLRTEDDSVSVHLCDYPTVNKQLELDEESSSQMYALLEVVSLGLAARNAAKVKVRQPMAELRVMGLSSGNSAYKGVQKYSDQIRDELNVKKVTLVEGNADPSFLPTYVPKQASIKFDYGKQAPQVLAALGKMSREQLLNLGRMEGTTQLSLPSGDIVTLSPIGHLEFSVVGSPGWTVVHTSSLIVGIDTRITPELKAEGLARDVVRFVQDARKDAGLDVADKIALYLGTESAELRQAIDTHRATIAAEVQAVERLSDPPAGGHATEVKVDGQKLRIGLKRV